MAAGTPAARADGATSAAPPGPSTGRSYDSSCSLEEETGPLPDNFRLRKMQQRTQKWAQFGAHFLGTFLTPRATCGKKAVPKTCPENGINFGGSKLTPRTFFWRAAGGKKVCCLGPYLVHWHRTFRPHAHVA
jgi:hypothetical protein